MCGIAGFVGKGDTGTLDRMIAALHHRGPDSTGVWMGPGVGLAHARLAIVDLTPSGHQPMWNEAQTVVIVFNGEIYNFRELREECVKKGYHFRGHSDTEVILALYDTYGIDSIKRLNGMFAIALYDVSTKQMFLARDRMGKKPLYVAQVSGGLVFGSELKALVQHSSVTKEIDPSAVSAFLALDYVPTPLSIYKGVQKLPPASIMTYHNGEVTTCTFWTPDDTQAKEYTGAQAIMDLDTRLQRAVESRLVADVPLGVFLSGGLDSSTVAYYASRVSSTPIQTFSIGFNETSFDESSYAKKVSKHLGTVHHHQMLSGDDSLRVLPKVFQLLDEPLADASIIPTYLLSEFTRKHVTVALGGDGGDELFSGYQTFQAEKAYQLLSRIPFDLGVELMEHIVQFMPSSNVYMSNEFKLRKFLEGARESVMPIRHMKWMGTFSEVEIAKILHPDYRVDELLHPYGIAQDYFSNVHLRDAYNRLLWMYQRTYMMDQVMVKVDRATMYNALEARAPFLDTEIVEFVNALPYTHKLHGLTVKYVLKKTMEGKLPNDIIHRTKKGFGVPVGEWLRGPLREWGESLLEKQHVESTGILTSAYVRELWDEHQSGTRDHRKKLWNILVFLEWHRNFQH